ncbi:MAG: hypothetical protein MUP41_20930, partial [Desulfobacterales bacterium]|nr:hypothetical protein [Desulfobacterales bacterium]
MTFLEDLGHLAVAPTLSPTFQYLRDEKVGWASPWSERHIAYACGLGTFSLNDGLITPKGMAVRFGSVVTLLKLTPSEKKYRHYRENCLQFRNEKCGKCIPRCPAGAISEKGHSSALIISTIFFATYSVIESRFSNCFSSGFGPLKSKKSGNSS